ncbi:protein TEX261-like [Saccoglossus kowalevskii]|uniref:Protein TEX261 n=1 Tax=Saccoglossus kowalevskii TaxID=10224 RepID=A0ABM0MKZ7_SACKO|nr:PREDICTED: protein TEX261-like [Saccoglossus kowalevskii]
MWFIYLLSWVAMAMQICLITLSLAAGLYYVAELVEEYTVMAAKIIKVFLIFTTVVYIGLILFEEFPLKVTLTGLFSNIIYSLLLRNFPFIELTEPVFLIGCVMVVVNHYLAFQYFASVWYPFGEVLSYFTICLWLVPFSFFVSLSANENVLPTLSEPQRQSGDSDDVVSNYFKKSRKRYGILSVFDYLQEKVFPTRNKTF